MNTVARSSDAGLALAALARLGGAVDPSSSKRKKMRSTCARPGAREGKEERGEGGEPERRRRGAKTVGRADGLERRRSRSVQTSPSGDAARSRKSSAPHDVTSYLHSALVRHVPAGRRAARLIGEANGRHLLLFVVGTDEDR